MIKFKIFKKYPEVYNLVTDSRLGSINPFKDKNAEAKLSKFTGIPIGEMVFADQVHGGNFQIVKRSDGGSIRLQTDALITNNSNLYLIIKTADCTPLLLFEPEKKVVAAIHAGRRGLVSGVIKNTIEGLVKNFQVSPAEILVGIGPHIRVEDYFLKEEALKELQDSPPASPAGGLRRYFKKIKNRIHFDLTALALDQLKEAGVKKENIEDCGICTYHSYQSYYSARKNEAAQVYREKIPTFVSIIGLRK